MIPEEFRNKVKTFENMMADFHRLNTGYDGRMANFISLLRNEFGKTKEKKIYHELLEELKIYYYDVTYEEYLLWVERIRSAFHA